MALIAIGLVCGGAATFPIGAALAKSVFGISRIDASVFIGVVTVLLVARGLATVVPAARSVHIDPLSALRQD